MVAIIIQLPPGDIVTAHLAQLNDAGGGASAATEAGLLRAQYGLDQPVYVQYLKWIGQLVRGNMGDGPGLASGVRGVPCSSTQVPGRTHRMAPGCTRFHHLDLATHPGTGMLDRMTRSWVPGLNRLEEAKDALRARGSP